MAKSSSRWIFVVATLALSLAGWAGSAQAGPTLDISGAITITIVDNSPQDMNPLPGAILFTGTGGAFVVNVDTGLSKPALPTPNMMDLNAVLVTLSTSVTDITFKLGDIGFGSLSGGANLVQNFGGTLTAPPGSTITFNGYEDNGNTLFGTGGPHVGPATFGPGPFGNQQITGLLGTSPFSLTETVTIHLTGPGTVSFDTELRIVPEPATLTLLGLGVLGLGACVWRRRKDEGTPTR